MVKPKDGEQDAQSLFCLKNALQCIRTEQKATAAAHSYAKSLK